MIPMLPFSPPTGYVNAYARVDKATSEFLSSPDWRLNIAVCDTINSKPWLARDHVRAVRGRLQHRNPNVQLLALTLLETIVKNCGEHVHVQIAERKVLQEMIKIVKKKANTRVRERILALIDTWQEAFGCRGGKMTAQYYHAYEELRRYGVDFPRRSPNTAPVITPPATNGNYHAGASSSRHEPVENVSLSALDSMRNTLDLLSEMLQAVDPKDRKAMKDEVIIDLYDQCRLNQKKLEHTLSSTTDEDILRLGIQFNDTLQYIIEKHDAIASGSPIPVKPPSLLTHQPRGKQIDSKGVNPESSVAALARISNEIVEEPDNLASRRNEMQTGKVVMAPESEKKPVTDPSLVMALVPSDPLPAANKNTIEGDLIDLFSLPLTPTTPSTSNPYNQTPTGPTIMENQPPVQQMNSYAVPWAQTRPQLEYEPQPPVQTIEQQPNYIPPPWAPTPGYYCNPYASGYSTSSYYNNGSSTGAGLNPYIPSYRLFEDLNVLGNVRTGDTPGTSGPCMLGGRK
ncbi:putative target of Myb protein [Helianthus annuus]|uniref:Target of Myb protein n=1 Tax=Helianthus annuus TaxID=4232 RepID=A0A251S441_HELAN|nr:TOM1-like protein 6 [Helianthus annuus]KAF5762687.1 putative target of Myb protein [Helianthus annuus]KAJ0471410.1 putative TOM1-like protein, plant [Helianthus annuus]